MCAHTEGGKKRHSSSRHAPLQQAGGLLMTFVLCRESLSLHQRPVGSVGAAQAAQEAAAVSATLGASPLVGSKGCPDLSTA